MVRWRNNISSFSGMFTAAFTLMGKEQWEACTSTTKSVPKDSRQTSLIDILGHLYRTDKVYASKKVAAIHNIITTYRDRSESGQEIRREGNRTWRHRSNVCGSDDAEGINSYAIPFA